MAVAPCARRASDWWGLLLRREMVLEYSLAWCVDLCAAASEVQYMSCTLGMYLVLMREAECEDSMRQVMHCILVAVVHHACLRMEHAVLSCLVLARDLCCRGPNA